MRRVWLCLPIIGCCLGCPAPGGGGTDAGDVVYLSDGGLAPTWNQNVQPIVSANCVGCHLEGGIAPFGLETYAQAKEHHAAMAGAVVARRMPPWLPSEDCQSFQGTRRLQSADIQVLSAWSEAGAPEGKGPSPDAGAPLSSSLPWVSSTLSMAAPYTPNGGKPDDYRCFILDPQLSQPRDVIGFEIVPGVRRMVHHVLLYAAPSGSAQTLDDGEAGPGWTCFGGPGVANPLLVGGWVPGTSVVQYPSTTGVRVPAGQVLVMQVHYNLQNGAPVPDATSVKLQYSEQPVLKPATILPLAQTTFTIPPKAQGYSAEVSVGSGGAPFKLWGVIPHMHVKGRAIHVALGNTCLMDIPKWSFHWQQFFFYQAPLDVPPNSSVSLKCTWDNPTDASVTWGEGTDDEMCLNYFYLTQ